MSKATSLHLPAAFSPVKLEPPRLALDPPLAAAASEEQAPDPKVQTQLKFVQIGVWEARRRCLAGQTDELDLVLAHLDEDIELLRRALQSDADKPKPRRR